MRAWSAIPVIEKGSNLLLLDGFWERDHSVFNCIMYDPSTSSLVRWQDKNERYIIRIRGNRRFGSFQSRTIEMTNPLNHRKELITEVEVLDQYPMIPKEQILEMSVQPQHQYFIRKQLSPGSWVSVGDDIKITLPDDDLSEIRRKLLGETSELIDLALENLPVLNSKVVNPQYSTFDIEVKAPRNVFPVPERAEYPVHAVGLSTSSGIRKVLILDETSFLREDRDSLRKLREKMIEEEDHELGENLSQTLEVKFFNTEVELLLYLEESLLGSPLLITFNGDGFDLPYIYHRMRKLGLNSRIRNEAKMHWELDGTIHLDLLQFLRKPSIRLYAFGGKYSNFTLDEIASSILGVRKVEHDDWFDEMDLHDTVRYTIKDVVITQKLFEYNNYLIWLLMILLMRLGKFTFSFLIRRAISAWLLQWVAYNHQRKGYFMPPNEDIQRIKGGFESSAGIDGKQYEGAIVLDPKPGVWWDVVVYDFASLYPSVIKSRNLGYDTIRCEGRGHKICRENVVPGLSHWVCRRHTSIMSSLVGYVRDLRVKWYKKLAKKEKDPGMKIQYNMIQAALKVFINASYGVLGTDIFPLFCPPAAEATTAFARNALLTFKRVVEDRGAIAVYGDTDSLFLYNTNKDEMDEILFEMLILHQMELGIDYDFKVLFLTNKKKNYFGVTKSGGIIVKGLQGKKSNTPVFIRNAFTRILDIYSTITDEDDFPRIKREVLEYVISIYKQLKSQSIEFENLATQFTLSKSPEEYDKKTPAVTLALNECLENPSFMHEIKQGLIFLGVKCNEFSIEVTNNVFPNLEEKKGSLLPCSFMRPKHIRSDQVDWQYYITTFQKVISPLLSPLGIRFEMEVEGQQSLNDYFGGD